MMYFLILNFFFVIFQIQNIANYQLMLTMSGKTSIHQIPLLHPLQFLISLAFFLPYQLNALNPSLTLTQYASVDTSPIILSHTDHIIFAAYHDFFGILLKQYCDKTLTNEYLVPKPTLVKLVQENSEVCGQGNIIFYESLDMIHVFNKENNSIVNSYSEYEEVMFGVNSSLIIYTISAVLFPSPAPPEVGCVNLEISQISNLTDATSFGSIVNIDLIYSKNQIWMEVISLFNQRIMFQFDSNLSLLSSFTFIGPSFLLIPDKIYVQSQYVTQIYSNNIDIYDLTGTRIYSIIRPNTVQSVCFFGIQLWTVESYNGTTILNVIDPSTQAQLTSFTLSETGVSYQIEYRSISDEVVLYSNQSNILLTAKLIQETPIDTMYINNIDSEVNFPTENITDSIQSEFVTNFSTAFFQEQTHQIMSTAQVVASISVASSILPSISRPIFSLIEDFWFYKFHPRKYPEFVQNLTEEFSLLNEIRIKPDFLDAILIFENQSYFEEQVVLYSQTTILKGRAPENQYLISAIRQVYMCNFAMVVFMFLLLYLFKAIIYLLSKVSPTFEKLYPFVESTIKIRNIYLSIVLPNLSVIIFFCTIQFRTFFCFDFFNKLNMLIAVSIFYLWLTTALISYLLIYNFEDSSSEDLLDSSKYGLKGFINEIILNNVRRLLQAIIHGLFLDSENYLIGLLCLNDLFVLISCLKFRKSFKSKIYQVVATLYFLTFFLFDLALLFFIVNYFPSLDFDLMILIIVLILFALTIIKTLICLLFLIKDLINFIRREFCANNMVQDLPENKDQKDEEKINDQQKQTQVKLKSCLCQNSKMTQKLTNNKQIDKQLNGITIEEISENIPQKLYVNVYEHEKKIRLVFTQKKKGEFKDRKVTFAV